jgi:hypothetical protein
MTTRLKLVEITSVNTLPRITGVPEGSHLQHKRAEPVDGLRREFHVLAAIARRCAAAGCAARELELELAGLGLDAVELELRSTPARRATRSARLSL